MLTGLDASEAHPENGMTRSDMQACVRVANQLGEVIIFRSTGPWAKRWLQEGFPSKNFHVKGKSSNWGPQAGFVPYDGIYSKVGADPVKALKGTQANQHGLTHSEFAVKSVLNLTAEQILIQGEEKAEGRLAIASRSPLPNGNIVMRAFRHGDNKAFTFLGKKLADGTYDIYVYPPGNVLGADPARVATFDPHGAQAVPLYVMGSAEVGANGKAMTGDYDLLAVCPPIRDRGSQIGHGLSTQKIFTKDDISLRGPSGVMSTAKGLSYAAGMNMDNVLDGRLHTASRQCHLPVTAAGYDEHADMGNVTPRILRCINLLNVEMQATGSNGWQRRVHHNAESHRFAQFGALVRSEMDQGEGFPFTAFLPASLAARIATPYTTVCTLENMQEFITFCTDLYAADYWVPKNYTWGMRNNVADRIDMFNALGPRILRGR